MGGKRKSMATRVRKSKSSPAGHLHGNKSEEPITFISDGLTIRCAKESSSSSNYVDRLKVIMRNPNLTVAEADSMMAFLKDPATAITKGCVPGVASGVPPIWDNEYVIEEGEIW